MKIVPVDEIPAAKDTPLDNPLDVFKLCKEMEDLCRKKQGIGLSATQVGIDLKLFVIDFVEKFRYFVNCEYEPVNEEKIPLSFEGCLSLPGRYFELRKHRWRAVRVHGMELVVKNHVPTFVDFDQNFIDSEGDLRAGATVFQHEIDHQLGQEGLICNIKGSKELDVSRLHLEKEE